MCLVFLAVRASASYPLMIAFNRDEVYTRPTRQAHWWEDSPGILGGRDLERHGTWAGVTRSGRIALLTFVRTPRSGSGERSKQTRGQIVADFLRGADDPKVFLEKLKNGGGQYLPYNVVAGRINGDLFYYSNAGEAITKLAPGLHGLSNAALNTPWPKVSSGLRDLRGWFASSPHDLEPVFTLMASRERYPDELLPRTGVPFERERALSSLFVEDGDYGTRTTTVIRLHSEGGVEFLERTHGAAADQNPDAGFTWTLDQS